MMHQCAMHVLLTTALFVHLLGFHPGRSPPPPQKKRVIKGKRKRRERQRFPSLLFFFSRESERWWPGGRGERHMCSFGVAAQVISNPLYKAI